MFLGYIIKKDAPLKGKHGKLLATIGWSTAIVLASLVIYGPWSVFKPGGKDFTDGENIMYSATHRFLWSCE